MRQSPLRRFAPSFAAFVLFSLLSLLWMAHHIGLYRHIVTIWGVEVFDYPFVDTETVLSGARCLRAGLDVYISNPCDTLGRVYDYSPLWMLIARLPVTTAWGMLIGLLIALIYFGALALLPEGRTGRQQLVIVLGAISTVAMFAVERGNNDLILFALAALTAMLVCRSRPFRVIGYSCALLAGLLKYYPMVLLALAARERPARLLAIAAVSLFAIALFMAIVWQDLARALQLIPTGGYYVSMFGSVQLAGGLQLLLKLPPIAVPLIRLGMTIAALALSIWLAMRRDTIDALATLTLPERAFLLAGGLLILASFFTAQNIAYRAIHLLLALPALLALRQIGPRLFRFPPMIVIALLWADCWRRGLLYATKHGSSVLKSTVMDIAWLVRECLWWWIIIVLMTCVIALLWRSTLLRQSRPLWA